MDRAHADGHQLLRHRERLRLGENRGWTERIVGDWFAQGAGRRERAVLATKLYGDMGDWPNEGKLSALNIRRACDASLQRLQTDYIDVYQMHHVDRATPWDEIWEAMDVLRQQGKILYVGSSNFAGWHIAQGQEAARRLGTPRPGERAVDLQPGRAHRRARGLARGPGLRPRSDPLVAASRRRARRHPAEAGRGWRVDPSSGRTAAEGWQHRPAIEAWEAFCGERGEDPADVALAWLLHQPAVTAPIVGPRTEAQLDGALRALAIDLDADALARLDVIFPGPGGTLRRPTPGSRRHEVTGVPGRVPLRGPRREAE